MQEARKPQPLLCILTFHLVHLQHQSDLTARMDHCTLYPRLTAKPHLSQLQSEKPRGMGLPLYQDSFFTPPLAGDSNGLAQVSILNPTPSLYTLTALKERLPRSLYPLPTHTSLKESLYTHPTHLYTHLKERLPRSLYSTTPLPTHTSLKEQFFEGDFMFGDLPPPPPPPPPLCMKQCTPWQVYSHSHSVYMGVR